MNKDHYVSLEIAKKLQEAEIEFPESDKVWTRYKIQVKDTVEWSDWYLAKRDFRDDLEGVLFSKYVVGLNTIPSPSLSELLDELPGYGIYKISNDRYIKSNYWRCARAVPATKILGYNNQPIDRYELYIEDDKRAANAPDAGALILLKLQGERENGPIQTI